MLRPGARLQAARAARAPLMSAQERQRAYVIAAFLRRRRGQGYGEATIMAQVARFWPGLPAPILDAAELLFDARRDGWPE
jgi:hypothetical protein